MEPMLVFRRSGRTIAAVLAFGFGGGTVLLGVGTAFAATGRLEALWSALWGYLLAASPFFVAAAVVAACRRELWFVPEARAFRMLTFRPWLWRGPRVEQASIDEYAGVCSEPLASLGGEATVVSLITGSGATVSLRELDDPEEADAFVQRLAAATGLPRRPSPTEHQG